MSENYWGNLDGNQGGLDEDYPACISCNTRDGVVEDDASSEEINDTPLNNDVKFEITNEEEEEEEEEEDNIE